MFKGDSFLSSRSAILTMIYTDTRAQSLQGFTLVNLVEGMPRSPEFCLCVKKTEMVTCSLTRGVGGQSRAVEQSLVDLVSAMRVCGEQSSLMNQPSGYIREKAIGCRPLNGIRRIVMLVIASPEQTTSEILTL